MSSFCFPVGYYWSVVRSDSRNIYSTPPPISGGKYIQPHPLFGNIFKNLWQSWGYGLISIFLACCDLAGLLISYEPCLASTHTILSRQQTTKVLIRLRGCTGWSAPLMFAYGIRHDMFTCIARAKHKSDFSLNLWLYILYSICVYNTNESEKSANLHHQSSFSEHTDLLCLELLSHQRKHNCTREPYRAPWTNYFSHRLEWWPPWSLTVYCASHNECRTLQYALNSS